MPQLSRRILTFLVILAAACGNDAASLDTTAQAVWSNGDFEADPVGTTPPSGWTIAPKVNPSITDLRPGVQTLASLNLGTGGVLMTSVVGGAPESQRDPDLGTNGTLRFPKYGQRATRVNYGSTSAKGDGTNVNTMKQTMTVSLGDVDPVDNKVHVRFAVAPILENPGHAYTQQPYYYVRLQNLTRGTTIYSDFNASGQPGVPWKNFTEPGGEAAQYTDWQLVDVSPGDAALAVGDSVELTIVAAGCAAGGHWGRVYVDAVGSGVPGLYSWGTGPQQANAGSDIRYTLNYKNGGTTTTTGTRLDFVTPPNTVYKSVSLGAACSAPAVGATGTVSCPLGTLANGSTGQFTVTVTIPAPTANGTVILNGNYSIYATGVSALVGPKVFTTVTSSVSYADLGVTISDGVAALGWGQATIYNIDVTNAGPVASPVSSVTDTMPAQLTGVTWTCTGTGGGSCAASGTGNINDGSASLPVGASLRYVVSANVVAGSGNGQVIHTVRVATTGTLADPDSTNNTALDTNAIGTLRTLTVARTGDPAGGAISSVPSSIVCGAGCAAQFLDGSQVVLTATPVSGATFVGWTGACSGTTNSCTVTMAGDQSVGAAFVGAPATVVVSSGSPQSTTVSTGFAAPLAVLVSDAGGRPVPGVTVAYGVPGSGATATLSATTATTNSAGIASVTATASATAGSYAASATVTGPAPASFALTNRGAPASITVTSGATQSATVATAFAPLVATVRDSASQIVPGVTVTFTRPTTGATATLAAATAITDASGQVSMAATANTVAGSYSITAAVVGVATPASFALTNLAGAPATLTLLAPTTRSASAGGSLGTFTVAVTDAFGNPVPGVSVGFAAPASGSTATLSSASVTTASNGRASITATAGTVAGAFAITASATGTSSQAFAITITAGAAAALTVVSGTPQSAVVDATFGQPLVVEVRDTFGNPVAGAAVGFTAPALGATAAVTASATTGATGQASTSAVAGAVAGTYSVTASATGLTSVGFALRNDPGAPAAISVVSGTPQSAVVDAAFGQPLVVRVVDSHGNLVSGATVQFSAPTSGATATLTGATATTSSTGQASALAQAGATAGSYTVIASVGAFSASFILTNTAGAATTIAVTSGDAQHAVVATTFAAPLVATVRDLHGNLVTGATVTFTAPATGARATVAATATSASDGRVTVSATAGTVTGDYLVTASIPGAQADFSLGNDPAAAASVTVVSGADQRATVATEFGAPIVLAVTDAFGNAVPGATVTTSSPATGASATLASAGVTDASGRLSITATAGSTAGDYSIGAAVTGAGSVTVALTNTAGPATTMAIVGASTRTATVDAPIGTLTVEVTDAFGNLVPGVSVGFAAPASGSTAALSATSVTTDASGRASITATAGAVAGSFAITASAPGTAAQSFDITLTAGAAATLAVVSGDDQHVAVDLAFAPLVVQARDSHGNLVPDAVVAFSAPTSGATALVTASATTGATGEASTTAVAGTVTGSYTVSATISGVTPVAFRLTNDAGAPAGISLVAGSEQTAVVDTAFALPLTARVVDSHGNVVPDAVVHFAAPSTGATAILDEAEVTTTSAGLAVATVQAGATAGSYTVIASIGTFSASFILSNTAGMAATIAVTSGDAQHAVVATAFAAPLVATVRDLHGNLVAGATVTFTAPATGAGAVVAGSASTDDSGRVSVPATAGTVTGAYAVTASIPGDQISFALTNDPGAPAHLAVISGADQRATVTEQFTAPLVVEVTDAFGNPVPGATITSATPSSGASASLAGPTVTDDAGRIAFTATAGTTAGSYAATISVAGAGSVTVNLTNRAGAPAAISLVDGDAQRAVVETTFGRALQVLVEDAHGNPVPNATVQFVAPATGATATVDATATTDDDGLASTTATAGSRTGEYQVVATVTGASTPARFQLTNTPAAPATVTVVSGDPQDTVVATGFAAPLTVVVRDHAGNPAPGVTVAFAAPAGARTAALDAALATTDALGQAEVGATASQLAGAYEVTAAIGVGTPAIFHLTNRADLPARVSAALTSSPQATQVLTAFVEPLAVLVEDRFGNPTPDATVRYDAPTSRATTTFASATAQTDADGHAAVIATASSGAGAYVANATVDGVADPAQFALTNLAGAPATLAAIDGDAQATEVDTDFAELLSLVVTDADGNPVPNAAVDFTASTDDVTAVLSAGRVATDVDGLASVSAHASRISGAHVVTARVTGAAAPVSFALRNTPGAPAAIVATDTSTPQRAQVATPYAHALVARVSDRFDNPVPDAIVTYAAPTSGATATPADATASTDSEGYATASVSAGNEIGTYDVTARVGGVTDPARFALTNTPGPAHTITARSGDGQTAVVDTAFADPLVARVTDEFGNPVAGETVSFAVPSVGASASAATASTVTDDDGVATTAITAGTVTGGYRVIASSAEGAAPAAFALTNRAGAPVTITVRSGATPQATQVQRAFAAPLALVVDDAFGNHVPDVRVTYAGPSTPGAELSAASATTGLDGGAEVLAIADDLAGRYDVTATVDGITAPVRFALTNTAAAPGSVVVVRGGGQRTLATAGFAQPVVFRVIDGLGNPVPDLALDIVLPTDGATVMMTATPARSDALGEVAIDLRAMAVVGALTVSAHAEGASSAASAAMFIEAIPTQTVATAPADSAVDQPVTVTIVVTGTLGVPTGSVDLLADGQLVGSATLTDGTAHIVLPLGTLGEHHLTARYAAQGSYAGSRSPELAVGGLPDSGSLSGSIGCSAGPGAGAGMLLIVLALLAALRPRRAARLMVPVAVAAVVVLHAASATAQDTGTRAIDRFHAAAADSAWFATDSLSFDGHAEVALATTWGYAHRPLVAYDSDGMERTVIVDDSLVAQAGASVTLFERVRLAATVPMAIYQDGDDATFNGMPLAGPRFAFGDILLAGDVRVVGGPRAPLRLAVGVRVATPSGSRTNYMSDGELGVEPRAMVAGTVGRVEYAAAVGALVRRETSLGGLSFGSELRYAASVGTRVLDGRLLIGPEVIGATPLVSGTSTGNPTEVGLGAHYRLTPQVVVGAGASAGVVNAVGTPDQRVFASVSWRP